MEFLAEGQQPQSRHDAGPHRQDTCNESRGAVGRGSPQKPASSETAADGPGDIHVLVVFLLLFSFQPLNEKRPCPAAASSLSNQSTK